jgi:hypothetical protein
MDTMCGVAVLSMTGFAAALPPLARWRYRKRG